MSFTSTNLPTRVVRYSTGALGCHSLCKSCAGPTKFECTSCFAGSIRHPPLSSGLTKFQCRTDCSLQPSTYYNPTTNTCLPCLPECDSCTGPNPRDCVTCKSPNLKLPDNSCSPTCIEKTFLDPTNTTRCLSCHPSCLTCSGALETNCITCANGFFRRISDNLCANNCGSGYYGNFQIGCHSCDSTCKECSGPGPTSCLECFNPDRFILNAHNRCIDCLDGYDVDRSVCKMTHKLTYSRCPYESKDPFSSLTIKFWIDDIEKHLPYLNKTLDLS